MQQKHKYSRVGVLFMAVLGVSIAVVTVLMLRDIPVPQQTIEKELDASAFTQK